MRWLRVLVFAVADVLLGGGLARYIDGLPMELRPLTAFTQTLIGLFAPGETHNPDTVEFVGGVVLLALSMIVVAVPLVVVGRLIPGLSGRPVASG